MIITRGLTLVGVRSSIGRVRLVRLDLRTIPVGKSIVIIARAILDLPTCVNTPNTLSPTTRDDGIVFV